jgi:hypothetical protein
MAHRRIHGPLDAYRSSPASTVPVLGPPRVGYQDEHDSLQTDREVRLPVRHREFVRAPSSPHSGHSLLSGSPSPLAATPTPLVVVSPSPISVPSASDLPDRRYVSLTTPFELFYGAKLDGRVLFKWGTVGYYQRCSDSGIDRGNLDTQCSVGLALGRSNQTNAMIFWDPATSRMHVYADYRLDHIASITSSYPNIVYDGHISPLAFCVWGEGGGG